MKIIKLSLKIGLGFIAFLIFLAVLMPKSGKVAPAGSAVSEASAAEASGVTMANFQRLETGMSYSDAVSILGGSGTEMSRSDLAGYTTVMYSWQGSGIANMNAMFQNGKLVTKAQFGLR